MRLIGITLLLALNIACMNSSLLEDFRNACPYSSFCTTPSLKTLNTSDDVIPCCYNCFCDGDCWAHGDCCLDLDPNKTMTYGLSTLLECKPAYIKNSHIDSLQYPIEAYVSSKGHFRIIDFCPGNYSPDNMIHKNCLRQFDVDPDYDDVVLVSDEKSRIFKNKHCAKCHGVFEPIRWSMVTEQCRDEIADLQLKLSEVKSYFLNQCILVFERPSRVPLNGRTLSCILPFETCGESEADQDIITGCNDGPYMPYFSVIYEDIAQVYKNAMCYRCFNNVTSTCPAIEPKPRKTTSLFYKVVLNQELKEPVGLLRQSDGSCREEERYDPYKEECRRVYCPPFEAVSNGQCTRVSDEVSNLYLTVKIHFTFENGMTVDGNNERQAFYNESMGKYYFRSMVRLFGFFNCEIYSYESRAWLDTVSKRYVAILADFQFKITESCTMQDVSTFVIKNERKNTKLTWLLNGNFFEMMGHISFFGLPTLMDSHYETDYLLYNMQVKRRVNPVTYFFLCPYFILEVDEYKQHVSENNRGNLPEDSSKLTFTTRMYPGFYALSENQVAVCVDTYLPSNDANAIFHLSNITTIVIIVTLIVFIEWNFFQ